MANPMPLPGQSTQSNKEPGSAESRAVALVLLIEAEANNYELKNDEPADVRQFLSALLDIRRQLLFDVVEQAAYLPKGVLNGRI
jgi:hypothetical protein